MDVDAALYRWAEEKYGLAAGSVTNVEFRAEDDGDWSEETPGMGPYMLVEITAAGRTIRKEEVQHATPLIREILEHAAPSGA